MRLFAIAVCPFFLLLPAYAQGEDVPSVRLQRLPAGVEAPRIDGVLDDALWQHAAHLGPLRQVEPVAGAVPSERTEVQLAYDERSIFLALRCYDSDPEGIRATLSRRDANLNPDDRVELLFDPFLDRRNAFWFQIGAGGSKGDALITRNGGRFNKQWDTIWYGKARITDEGWFAEIEIPTASINFDERAPAWGFNVRRLIRRRSEEARWATPTPRIGFFSVANAGTLEGFRGLQQGLGLDIKPFGVMDWTRDVDDDEDYDPDAGLDLFYRLTPAVKLSLSFNTDFAETEVDERQVNLTRFPLFFPEKRDFFLEDSGVFEFGDGDRDIIPFFSRRIGIDSNGEEVPLLVAAKLTGQTDAWSFGVLDVQADSEGDLDSQNLFAGRFSKNILEQSDAGFIWTQGDPIDEGRNATAGVDLNLRTDAFRGGDNLRFTTYLVGTEGDDADGFAYRAVLSYPNDEVDASLSYEVVEDEFDPALGRARRRGIKSYEGSFAWKPRLYSDIRQLDFRVRPRIVTDSGNDTESVDIFIQPLEIEFESGDEFDINLSHRREVLDEDFDITDDVTVDEDAYTFFRYGSSFDTSEKRPVSVGAGWEGGEFFDGKRDDYELQLDVRFGDLAEVGAEYEINDVRLDDGDFTVHVARLRLNLQFGPEVSWSNYFQYDNQSEQLGLNSRFWWIPRPETEIFLVFNQGWEVDSNTFSPQESQVTLKVGYTFRL